MDMAIVLMENKKFNVYYSETRKQLLVRLGLPLLGFGLVMLVISLLLSLNAPPHHFLIVVFSGTGLLVAGILYAELKLIMVPTEIEITEEGIHFHILKGNPYIWQYPLVLSLVQHQQCSTV